MELTVYYFLNILHVLAENSPAVQNTNPSKIEPTDLIYNPLKLTENILSLDEAIITSILTCGFYFVMSFIILETFEQQVKMFSNVYIVGGGCFFEGTDEFLQYRLEALMPRGKKYKELSVDVVTKFVVFDLFNFLIYYKIGMSTISCCMEGWM